MIDGEFALHVLAERDRPLLPVQHLITAVVTLHPVHDVQGEAAPHGANHLVALPVPVDELALERRADVQPAAEPPDAILRRIDVARDDLAHGNPVKLDLHFFVLLLNYVPRNDFTR